MTVFSFLNPYYRAHAQITAQRQTLAAQRQALDVAATEIKKLNAEAEKLTTENNRLKAEIEGLKTPLWQEQLAEKDELITKLRAKIDQMDDPSRDDY